MTNIIQLKRRPDMEPTDIVDTLLEAGFSKEQAVGLTGVITAIRAGRLNHTEAETLLRKHGFDDRTAGPLTDALIASLGDAA